MVKRACLELQALDRECVLPRHSPSLKVWTDSSGVESPLWALRYLGVPFECIQHSEIDLVAQAFTEKHFGRGRIQTSDMTQDRSSTFKAWGKGRIHLYCCGFPCPSFSQAGCGGGAGLRGPRGQITAHMLHAITELEPRTFLLENVERLMRKHKDVLRSILHVLLSMHNQKYHVTCKLLNSLDSGIPQNRPRINILGIDKQYLQGTWSWPTSISHVPLAEVMEPLTDAVTAKCMPPASQGTARQNYVQACKEITQWLGSNPLQSDIVVDLDGGWGPHWVQGHVPCLTRSRSGKESHWLMSRGRRLNLVEQLRLMGLRPRDIDMDCISHNQLGKLLGNGMAVNVLERVLRRLLSHSALAPLTSMAANWESYDAALSSVRNFYS